MGRRAVILAGGRGTRLKPYTVVLPKPLMPIGDYPILEIVIRRLRDNGFRHITMAVNHQADIIKAFFGNGEKWGVKIDYSVEDLPLSTMGPLKLIRDLPENFLVMNGDILTDMNFADLYAHHIKCGNNMTVASFIVKSVARYGVIESDEKKRLINFREKPVVKYEVSAGVYILNRSVLKHIPRNKPCGFDELMLTLIRLKKPASIHRHTGYWADIGNPEEYARASGEFENKKRVLLKAV